MAEVVALRKPRQVRVLRVDEIDPDPEQPRQEFDEAQLRELAASIREQGLMQPITVTPRGERFMIVAGERRWRAHRLLGRETIDAHVEEMDDATKALRAIIENAQRADITPLEEAAAFARVLATGMSVEQLAQKLGMAQHWRITERTCLLSLREEYQRLLRSKQLTHSQAFEMAQLSPAGQDALFRKIRTGACPTYNALRAAALELRESEAQTSLVEPVRVDQVARRRAQTFESRVKRVAELLRASSIDNEVVAVRKVNAHQAARLADLFGAMKSDVARIERALRSAGNGESPALL